MCTKNHTELDCLRANSEIMYEKSNTIGVFAFYSAIMDEKSYKIILRDYAQKTSLPGARRFRHLM